MANRMRLTELLQTTTGSCDFGSVESYGGDTFDEKLTAFWKAVITVKSSDTGFGHLVDSILRKGFDERNAIGWDRGRIWEGHHRLVACILLCEDEVWVTDTGGNDTDHHTNPPGRQWFSAHSNNVDPYPIEIVLD